MTIGTLFIYDDGGMSLKLDAVPLGNGNISFYDKKPKDNQPNQQGGYQAPHQNQGYQQQPYQPPQPQYQNSQGQNVSQQQYQQNMQNNKYANNMRER